MQNREDRRIENSFSHKKLKENKTKQRKITLNIYSQNISGGKSKLYKINNALAISSYDILCIQESWFDQSITNGEITASTNYNICRKDRSFFASEKTRGGGVAIIIRNNIAYTEIPNHEQTLIEYITVRIKHGNRFIWLINVYAPLNTGTKRMINEIQLAVTKLRKSFANDEFIMVGDFNMSNITWSCDFQELPFLSYGYEGSGDLEQKFIEMCSKTGLYQMNAYPNSQGKFLDLVLSSEVVNVFVEQPDTHELIDNNSIHHNAVSIQIYSLASDNELAPIKNHVFNIKLKDSKSQLSNTYFELIPNYGGLFFEDDESILVRRIDDITGQILEVQQRNTVTKHLLNRSIFHLTLGQMMLHIVLFSIGKSRQKKHLL